MRPEIHPAIRLVGGGLPASHRLRPPARVRGAIGGRKPEMFG